MNPARATKTNRGPREVPARVLGVAAALAVMATATLAIEWPAPGIAIAVGFGVYLLARDTRR